MELRSKGREPKGYSGTLDVTLLPNLVWFAPTHDLSLGNIHGEMFRISGDTDSET